MSLIRIEDIAHVRFRAPDLARLTAFLLDFGLTPTGSGDGRVFMRGAGASPFLYAAEAGATGFAALGLRASGRADLEILSKAEGAPIVPLDAPGGGEVVRLTDPDGFLVEVV
ncbi:MAG TPA: hypothetical protein VF459_10010, partial [Caulobacteraceae bacterium]